MEINFEKLTKEDYINFREDIKNIFSIAVIEEFGARDNGEVIPNEDIDEPLYNENSQSFYIYVDNKKVGGVVLNIDTKTNHNSLDLLYIYPECHSKGLGYNVWKKIEEKYPETEVWETITPYFEKRNINFYVNKCGFHIVEFFNKHHKDKMAKKDDVEFKDEYFRFEKNMKK